MAGIEIATGELVDLHGYLKCNCDPSLAIRCDICGNIEKQMYWLELDPFDHSNGHYSCFSCVQKTMRNVFIERMWIDEFILYHDNFMRNEKNESTEIRESQ